MLQMCVLSIARHHQQSSLPTQYQSQFNTKTYWLLSKVKSNLLRFHKLFVTPHPNVQPGPTIWQTPFSGLGDVPQSGHTVNEFRRPAILQLKIKGLTASKMNVLYHLAVQIEVLVILLQETHCTCADNLTIPGFAIAGSSLSRKHGLATFVHDRLKWRSVTSYIGD